MKHSEIEILAPAGSIESMKAAIAAGADAVYMGGSRFGARAYADNPQEDEWLEAIDYAHLHGCKLYMTVNTLMKDLEMTQLYDYLEPYYARGLDAAIVQDMGVFTYLREAFPGLALHASTQMTITGVYGAKLMKEMGAERIVTARELSLEEIAAIHEAVDIEIESFVHGALCYCYSGQCLMSSLIGGRSGNRGRCAQPCRLPYTVFQKDKIWNNRDEKYVLSLKDMCTLDIIPQIIESGVYSMKIEGRMKSPRYTAGVVSIYRKYVDLYFEKGKAAYKVDEKDRRMLLDLFDRGGQTNGYYVQHNGREMVALKEKPTFREGNQALFDRLDEQYVHAQMQEAVIANVALIEGREACMSLTMDDGTAVRVTGAVVQTAQNQPLSKEKLEKQLNKTGGTPFVFKQLDIKLEGNCFMPVQALNEMRRMAIEQLQKKVLAPYQREGRAVAISYDAPVPEKNATAVAWNDSKCNTQQAEYNDHQNGYRIHVSLEQPSQLTAALEQPDVAAVYLDSTGFDASDWKKAVEQCHEKHKECALILPVIFRTEAKQYFDRYLQELKHAGFDAIVIRSLEERGYLMEQGITLPLIFDYGVYTMNRRAEQEMTELGASRLTLPVELNSRELEKLACKNSEMIVYGYLPLMVSAQCIVKTEKGCKKTPGLCYLKDRMNKELPVKNHCRFCYNTIYNTSPLSLLGQEKLIGRIAPSVLRLSFTVESPEQVRHITEEYTDSFLHGQASAAPSGDFTRGHFKRGVE